MANKALFNSQRGKHLAPANIRNEAGGLAYAMDAKHALAQYAVTGTLNSTFYADAETQLQVVLNLAAQVDAEFVAKVAVYARRQGFMKDVPALLVAHLSTRDVQLFDRTAWAVIDNAKMLRNFVQVMRSGVVGRKSLGTRPKRFVQEWLHRQDAAALFRGSVGNSPSLVDVLRMVHPKPRNAAQQALYGYLLGKSYDNAALPQVVRDFEAFKQSIKDRPVPSAVKVPNVADLPWDAFVAKLKGVFTGYAVAAGNELIDGPLPALPDVPHEMLTALPLNTLEWAAIARRAGWHALRMNLNAFARHYVFQVRGMSEFIARRLADAESIRKARVFPYQILAAWKNAEGLQPELRDALRQAMEVAVENVPQFEGKVNVLVDVSGSMQSPVTGKRKGSTSKVSCLDVASLIAAAVVRKNRSAEVIPFHDRALDFQLQRREGVMELATRLAAIPAGGTNCSAPLKQLNLRKAEGDLVLMVSDNQSWGGSLGKPVGVQATPMMVEWEAFRQRNPQARLVCLDVQPYATTQAQERSDVLNVGGFSDAVFEVINLFSSGQLNAGHWGNRIQQAELP